VKLDSSCPIPRREITLTTDNEALVRRAHHFAEGDVLDVQGFVGLLAEDGVCNGIGGVTARESYRGESNCHIGTTSMFAQLGVLPNFTAAVGAS
jgi:hypothetical protein